MMWDCYYPQRESDLPDHVYALIFEEDEYDPLTGLTLPRIKRAFPVFDLAHARTALMVCAKAEYYEKTKGWTVFPNREQRYQVRKAVWERWGLEPVYHEKETEIEVTLEKGEQR